MDTNITFSESVIASLSARQQADQWESFVVSMLVRLELTQEEIKRAETKYKQLAHQIAKKLNFADTDVHVVVQGSMRTQTTISPRGSAKFDLDIVIKLTGSAFDDVDADTFFTDFGKALEGLNETMGDPEPRRRCWRLQYPGEPFYFDVTPAIPGSLEITGTDLRVRDPETEWSPSNPEEFADWFCNIADLKFSFQERKLTSFAEAKSQVDPLPTGTVGIDDVLRRVVQLLKLHRENSYYQAEKARKDAMPISIVIVTLAASAFKSIWEASGGKYASSLALALKVVEAMPNYIRRGADGFHVDNPMFPSENFADRWNHDKGARAAEFHRWHSELKTDLQGMFAENYNGMAEHRIRKVFGKLGVEAWKKSLPSKPLILDGLLASAPNYQPSNPSSPTPLGSSKTLA